MDSKIDYPDFKHRVEHGMTPLMAGHYNFMSALTVKRANKPPTVFMRTVCIPALAGRPKHVQRAILVNTARALTDELWEDCMQWQRLNHRYPGVKAR